MTSQTPDGYEPPAPAFEPAPRRPAAAGDVDPVLRDDMPARQNTLGEVHAREKEQFGGFKFGTAFFGWLTATGTAVILTALVGAIGAAIGIASDGTVDGADAADGFGGYAIIAAIVLGIVLFVAYFAGGYVAGRMARFSGLKQGLAVWLWAVVIAIVVAIVTAFAGGQADILGGVSSFPRIPVTAETATVTAIFTALGAAVVTLAGALLGGVAGMRFHRRVDRAGLAG